MPIDTNILAAILGPFITALIGAGTVAFRNLQSIRRIEDERARILAQVAQEAAFLDAWLAAHDRLEGHPERQRRARDQALIDLERLYATLRSVDITTDHRARPLTLGRVLKALLLIPVRHPWAQVVRIAYYLSAVVSGGMIVVSSLSVIEQPDAYPGIGGVLFKVVVGVVATILLLLPTIALWGLARFLDRPPKQPKASPEGYPPAHPGAPLPPHTGVRPPYPGQQPPGPGGVQPGPGGMQPPGAVPPGWQRPPYPRP